MKDKRKNPLTMTNRLGERLRDLREDRKMTQKEVADMTDLSDSTISNYENGVTPIRVPELISILGVYGVLLQDFFNDELPDYAKDMEMFKAYGFSETFFSSLYLAHKYEKENNVVDWINLVYENPLHANSLFEGLNRFFDYSIYEEVNSRMKPGEPVRMSVEAYKRMLLEPIFEQLSRIFDVKYGKRMLLAFGAYLKKQQAEENRLQEEMFELYQRHQKYLKIIEE